MKLLLTFLVILGIFFISFLLINIRYIVIGKEFRGTCAQNNPLLKSKVGECTVCGKKPEEECQQPSAHA